MLHLKQIRQSLGVLLIAMAITACGFHLRGNIPLPDGIKNMFLVAPEGDFKDTLSEALVNAGAELADNKAAADVVLRITQAAVGRDVGTLDERGKANSNILTFKVKYVLETLGGEKIRNAALKEKIRYDFNANQIIESESEEEELIETMEQEIALRIVRQLSTVTSATPNAKKAAN